MRTLFLPFMFSIFLPPTLIVIADSLSKSPQMSINGFENESIYGRTSNELELEYHHDSLMYEMDYTHNQHRVNLGQLSITHEVSAPGNHH